MHKQAVIIGGGISGLSAAFFLSQRAAKENLPIKITVLEAEDRFGGVLRTLRTRDFHMEAGADAFDGRDPEILAFCRDLGLQDELLPCESTLNRVFLFKNKRFLLLDPFQIDPGEIFKSPILSLNARLRLLLEALIPSKKDGSDESVAEFVKRRFGKLFLRELTEPLVRGVLMGDPARISLHEYFPQWQKMEREYGSISRAFLKKSPRIAQGDRFFTLRGGLDRLAGTLLKKSAGAELNPLSQAVSLEKDEIWKVFLRDGQTIEADIVFIALPAPEAVKLLSDTAPRLAGELAKIRYDSLAAVNMIFCRGSLPDGFPQGGFIVPLGETRRPFAGLKVIGQTGDGKYMKLRAFVSGILQPEILSLENEKIQREAVRFLVDEFGVLSPCWTGLERYPEALPQYGVGHAALVSRVEGLLEQFPGLFLAGNGYHGFGISDCIRSTQAAVRKIKLL